MYNLRTKGAGHGEEIPSVERVAGAVPADRSRSIARFESASTDAAPERTTWRVRLLRAGVVVVA